MQHINKKKKTHEHSFTRNVVCITVSGPQQPTLTLIDLPGIIRSTADDNQKSVELVKNLVRLV